MDSIAHRSNTRDRSGQAIVEFIVGLVAVLTLLAGILQVASLTKTHTDTVIEARRRAAELAMTDLPRGTDIHSNPDWLRTWRDGPDGRPHSHDDVPVFDDPNPFRSIVVQRAAPAEDWNLMYEIPNNRVARLRGAHDPGKLFGLVRGHDSRPVPLIPAARHLFYDAESIDVQAEAWIPWLKGLY